MVRKSLKRPLDMSDAATQRIAKEFVHPDDLLIGTLEEDNQGDVAKTNQDQVTEKTKMKANISNKK